MDQKERSVLIAEVLEAIRRTEERPGYEGPKIIGYISSVAAMQDLMRPGRIARPRRRHRRRR